MSSMLEQAIADATELRESAIKNAEQVVIEKYSSDIKEAVEQLLEQDETLEMPDMGMGAAPAEESPVAAKAPFAHEDFLSDSEEEKEEKITINLSDIAKELSGEEVLAEGEEVEITEQQLDKMLEDLHLDEEETFELGDDVLEEIVKFSHTPAANGHLDTPDADHIEAAEIMQIKANFEDELEKSEKKNKELKEAVNNTVTKNKKLYNAVKLLKEKLDELTSENGKLLYTNRVLEDESLNRRQKKKIVEALSKAQTLEETKIIYETLQNAVGSTSKRKPKSLSEAVNRRSSLIINSRNPEKGKGDYDFAERMQRLAGINN